MAVDSRFQHPASRVTPEPVVVGQSREGRGLEIPNNHFVGVSYFFMGWRCILTRPPSPSSPKEAQLFQSSEKACPMSPYQQQTPTDPRASGLFVQPNFLPAGADEPGEGIPAMQGLVEGVEGEECGVETQHTVPSSSLALEDFDSFLKNKECSSFQQPFILNACPAWAQGLGSGQGTSVHPQLAWWSTDGTFLSAHRS